MIHLDVSTGTMIDVLQHHFDQRSRCFSWQADEYAHPILEDDPLPVEIGSWDIRKTLGILELDQTIDAVDERDPAPPNMCETVPTTGYSP